MGAKRDDSAFETCQIVFWRGYVKCAFYAVGGAGEPVESPFFRSGGRSPIEAGKTLEAHRALVERLADEGWEPAVRGRAWYAMTFHRRDSAPLEEGPRSEASAVETHGAPPEAPPATEPEPPAAVPEAVPPSLPAARRSRRQLALLLATAVPLALAVVLGLTLYGPSSAQDKARATVRPQSRQKPHVRPRSRAVTEPADSRRLVQTTIVVTGSRGASWTEAHVGSETGKLLFAGVVADGQTVRVTAPVVWISFGAAGNLDVRVNGRALTPGTFNGTITAVVAHGRVRPA